MSIIAQGIRDVNEEEQIEAEYALLLRAASRSTALPERVVRTDSRFTDLVEAAPASPPALTGHRPRVTLRSFTTDHILRHIECGRAMRVIAGLAKGRRLRAVPGTGTRPITDRVKEALFDILQQRLPGCRFLDLFSGTGSVGIEALSRGAELAVFVERNPSAVAVIRQNLHTAGLSRGAEVIRDDVFRFLQREPRETFDLVYVAPPQYKGLWLRTLQALDSTDWLSPQGLIVVQIHPKEYADAPLQGLALGDQRRYGSTTLCFYAVADRDDG